MSPSSQTTAPISSNVQETLDPCVVLMKSMMAKYAHLWDEKGGVFSLAQGVVYWEPPASVTKALQDALAQPDTSQLHMYGPDEGLPILKEALQKKVAVENDLSHHNIMITTGANQAYMNCVMTLLGQGDECVVFAPYYFNHVMAIQLVVGNQGVNIGSCSDDGVPDLTWLRNELVNNDKIKAVTVTNPGNPTGVALSQDVLKEIVQLCREYNKWLILDCTYEHFVHSNKNSSPSHFECFGEDHVIHIFSFSKGYALAGFRCGYLVIHETHNDTVLAQMRKVQDTIPICPARVSQIAALGALDAGREWVDQQVATLKQGRAAICDALSPLSQIMGGSGAMYVMGQLPDHVTADDREVARRLVEEYGVAVIPGSFCGFPGWIRVCYSNLPPDRCEQAAARLRQGLTDICKG